MSESLGLFYSEYTIPEGGTEREVFELSRLSSLQFVGVGEQDEDGLTRCFNVRRPNHSSEFSGTWLAIMTKDGAPGYGSVVGGGQIELTAYDVSRPAIFDGQWFDEDGVRGGNWLMMLGTRDLTI